MEGPDVTEATSTFMLSQEVKLNNLTELGVKSDAKHADLDRFRVDKNPKTSNTDLLFLKDESRWIYPIKTGGGLYAVKTLRYIFRGLGAMKEILGIETFPTLDRSIKAAEKLNSEIDL